MCLCVCVAYVSLVDGKLHTHDLYLSLFFFCLNYSRSVTGLRFVRGEYVSLFFLFLLLLCGNIANHGLALANVRSKRTTCLSMWCFCFFHFFFFIFVQLKIHTKQICKRKIRAKERMNNEKKKPTATYKIAHSLQHNASAQRRERKSENTIYSTLFYYF